ncbi:MAG: DUF2490 domain-containing protein [Acidobacteriota bacterium]
MKTLRFLRVGLCLLSWLSAGPVSAADDFRAWSQYLFTLHRTEKLNLGLYYEARLRDDGSDAFAWFSGPKLTYDLNDNLSIGGAIKYIEIEGNDVLDGRLELELTPKWVAGKLRFDFRNRIEVFHENGASDSTRFRHRLRCQWPLKRGWLDRLFFSAEFFHQDGAGWGELFESRIVPLGARLKLSPKASLDVFYLRRSRDRSSGREHFDVLGTLFILRR